MLALGEGYLSSSSEVIATALGFRALRTSRPLGWRNLEMLAWRGQVDECAYETLDEPVIVYHVGGAPKVPVETHREPERLSRPGSVTVVPARTAINWHVDGGVHSYSVHLAPSCFSGLAGEGSRPAQGLLDFRCGKQDVVLSALLDALVDEFTEPTEIGSIYAETLADSIGVHLVRSAGRVRSEAPASGLSREALRKTLESIEANLDTGLSLQELAQSVGICRAHFARSFKQAMGATPHGYITQRRIALAKSILSGSSQSLCEVALVCGFANQAHFTSRFRRMTGHTPARFRHLNA